MRSREEIEQGVWEDLEEADMSSSNIAVIVIARYQLEALLDIRDLLVAQDTRPVVTHPMSPPPPEVKT